MHSLGQVLELIQKTGDRCIVLPQNDEKPYVILSLPEYERLVLGKSDVTSLTEDELLDKINRDIAIWKTQQELDNETEAEDNWLKNRKKEQNSWADQNFDFEDEDDDELVDDPYYFESIDR